MEKEIIEHNIQNLKILEAKRKKSGKTVNKNTEYWQHYRERVKYRLLKVITEAKRAKSLSPQEMFMSFIDLKTGSDQLKRMKTDE